MINIVSKRRLPLYYIQAPVNVLDQRNAWYSAKAKQNCEAIPVLYFGITLVYYAFVLEFVVSFLSEYWLPCDWTMRLLIFLLSLRSRKLIGMHWSCLYLSALILLLLTSLHHVWQGNFCQHFYVANCCVVKPPEWEGYSCAADQSLRASTVRALIFFLHQLLIINKLTNQIIPFAIAGTLYRINHFTLLRGSSLPTLLWDEKGDPAKLCWTLSEWSMLLIARSY